MNEDTLTSTGQGVVGQVKEAAGDMTGDNSLKSEGMADQLTGKLRNAVGSVEDALGAQASPLIDQFKQFARDRPFATAAAVGVIGVAVLNSLRGKS